MIEQLLNRGNQTAVAVIGAGRFGSLHAAAWAAHPRACLVAVVDSRPETRSIAEGMGAAWCPSVDELPRQVAAASVALPPDEHAEVGCRLLERGCHVLVEKPMASSLAGADQMIATAAACGRVLQVGYVERFNPAVAWLRHQLDAPPLRLDFQRIGPPPVTKHPRNVVLDLMIHDIDLALWLTQERPAAVHVVQVETDGRALDEVHAELVFATGRSARLLASYRRSERQRCITATTAAARHEIDLLTHMVVASTSALPRPASLASGSQPLDREIGSFLRAVADHQPVAVSGVEGRAALAVALEIAAAAGLCEPVPNHAGTSREHPR